MKSPTSLDARAYFKKFRITYKINLKEIKSLIKEKNFTDAKQKIDESKRELKMTKNYIKSCDSTIGSIIFGFFYISNSILEEKFASCINTDPKYCSYCQ